MNAVDTVPGKVVRFASNGANAVLLHLAGAQPVLRIAPLPDCEPQDIAAFERLAEKEGACTIETQGKVPSSSRAAAALRQREFQVSAEVSRMFEIDVSIAAERLERFRSAARHRIPNIRAMQPCAIELVARIVQQEELIDDFELLARLQYKGAGGVDIEECPFLEDAHGVAGFILIAHTDIPEAREIKVRWVAPRYRNTGLLNLALLLDCLDRAARADVRYAIFSANTQRHAETLTLAAKLGARYLDDYLAFTRQLGSR